ncbi:MAG: hypothetical protein ABSE70_06150 [Candidatus Limnocylindrales bacterium]
MARLRGFGVLAIVGLVVGVSGCTSAAPASSAQAAELHRQAQEALTRWDAAVAAGAGGSGFILVGESTLFVGQDWGPNIDGDNAKMALYAGLFVVANPLPSEAPPDGRIQWQDGTTHTVPVTSAQQAFSDMKAAGVSPCPDCIPLQITGARLTTATFQSSRGPVQAPAWEFSLKDTDVKLDQVAVGGRFIAPPVPTPNDEATGQQVAQPWIGPPVQSATVDASGMTLTVAFTGAPDGGDKPCGADYTAEAVESDAAVVVIVYEHPNTTPVACSLVGAFRTAEVTLAKPLAERTLIDLQAQPISVTAAH